MNISLEELMPTIKECLENGKTVSFMPKGTSMLPLIYPDVDKVILSTLPEKIKKYDIILYKRKNGQYVLHRVIKVSDTYTFCGDNQFDLETGIEYDQMIAVVSSFTHKGRLICTDNLLYRIYCCCWCLSRTIRHVIRHMIIKIKN